MTILALDAATGPCSVAVWKDGRIAAYLENLKPVMQSASLMPMVEEALAQSGTRYSDLSGVACTVGPGSFTGLRVALAAARGICFAAKVKGLGFTTLETMAFAAGETPVLAALNAGKGEYYYQAFHGKPLFEPRLGTLEVARAFAPGARLIGNAPDAEGPAFPRADTLARLAAAGPDAACALQPFYIRPPDAKPQIKYIERG
jgi:tRNA threonylcarbamoyladenosine biosynthesis protein TsaB